MNTGNRYRCQTPLLAVLGAWLVVILLASSAVAQGTVKRSRLAENALRLHQKQYDALHREFSKSLEEIASYCENKKYIETARDIRKLAVAVETSVLRVDPLPKHVQPAIPAGLPADERFWRTQLRHAQKEYARKLYLLSRRALHAGFPSYAYHLVREIARHDPDHKSARRLLGYVRFSGDWVTPYAAQMKRSRFEWHDRFGWLPKTHIERYENGQRYYNRRWISAAQEAEIRRDFNKAWEIRTNHYLIRTNHSLERGVEVAVALEEFYRVFFQVFAGFFNTPEQMDKLFEGAAGSSRRPTRIRPYKVNYYRTRDEYNSELQEKIPQIAITNGLYFTGDRKAYFYHDPKETNNPTLYHEATHQLFYESSARDRAIAESRDFWIVEGIACYMESFRHEHGEFSLGDPNYIRFDAARYRYLNDGYFVPLEKFASMGMRAFQTDRNISKNYSQASGLSHFFMHYENGRYRDALIEHLSHLYRANPRKLSGLRSLEALTGVDYATLDRQYGEHLKSLEEAANPLQRTSP